MGFKLVIADVVDVPVRCTFGNKDFSFTLHARRDAQPLLDAALREDGATSDFMRERVTGWRGQTLVIDDATGAPAEFSAEAFDVMLSVAGMPRTLFLAYLEANSAKAKAKN